MSLPALAGAPVYTIFMFLAIQICDLLHFFYKKRIFKGVSGLKFGYQYHYQSGGGDHP